MLSNFDFTATVVSGGVWSCFGKSDINTQEQCNDNNLGKKNGLESKPKKTND